MADDPSRSKVHDLNNLFQVILGTLELMKRTRQAPPETVEKALEATRDAAALAQRLLGSPKPPPDGASGG